MICAASHKGSMRVAPRTPRRRERAARATACYAAGMSTIDRITATRRPEGKAAGYQAWQDLFFLHWPVPHEALRPLVPPELELDAFDGQAWVGLVPFAMRTIRPWRWWPRALAFDFLETNLRTYVHVAGRDPGVYFFSLEASSWLAVRAARALWSLPYHHARMSMTRAGDRVDYTTTRRAGGATLHLEASVGAPLGPQAPDSLEFFLFERYLLHTVGRGRLLTGQVHHTPYPVHAATVHRCEQTLDRAAGLDLSGPPPLTHFAPGVTVDMFALRPHGASPALG